MDTNSSQLNVSESWSILEEKLVEFSLDTFQIVSHWICIALGTIINLAVGAILICNRRLHNARNTIYVGIVFSNLLTLLMALMEILTVCWSNHLACSIYSVMIGKPYILVLVNFLLATCDRYLYITSPLVHKKYVTVSRVVAIQLILSVIIMVSMSTAYWASGSSIRCGLDLEATQWTARLMITLNFLCLIAKSIVYHLTKKCIATQMKNGMATKEIPLSSVTTQTTRATYLKCGSNPSSECGLPATSFFVHCNQQRFSRMELEATAAFVAGLIPLCIFTLPMCVWIFWEWLCENVFHSQLTFNYIQKYFRELLLIHVCTNLLVLVFLSKEFQSTVKDNLVQIKHRFDIRTQSEG